MLKNIRVRIYPIWGKRAPNYFFDKIIKFILKKTSLLHYMYDILEKNSKF